VSAAPGDFKPAKTRSAAGPMRVAAAVAGPATSTPLRGAAFHRHLDGARGGAMTADDMLQLWALLAIGLGTIAIALWRLPRRRFLEAVGDWLYLWSGGSLLLVMLEAF
jgi:hypothetical protein